MAQVTFDTVELENFVKRLGTAAQGDFKRALNKFLEGLGIEFLRILQDEIVRRNVLDYRLLLHSFQKGDGENVWTLDENGLTLEVGTNVEYAKFVNDGHWTNPKGIERRFVPGHWEKANGKDRFIYTPGEKTGMVLKMKWVEGSHYWESSIRILEKLYPLYPRFRTRDYALLLGHPGGIRRTLCFLSAAGAHTSRRHVRVLCGGI